MIDLPVIEAPVAEASSYAFRDEAIIGTRLNLLLVAENFHVAQTAALAVRSEIDRLDLILNSRDDGSELSLLNRSPEHRASPELFAVVAAAEQWRVATRGAFSGRLGKLIDLWNQGLPSRDELRRLADDAHTAHVVLDAISRTIVRPAAVQFALDALAKGWIVDQAFAVAMAMPGIAGAMIDIGGDVRCGGRAPSNQGWCVGVADPRLPFDNAPLVAMARVDDRAIATSGRGPRDRVVAGERVSPTLSPFDGWPVDVNRSASVIASSAATADALATAAIVLPEDAAVALLESHSATARLSEGRWTSNALALFTAVAEPEIFASDQPRWESGWQALATFTAPRRQLIRDPKFRSPYVAMWITDVANRPVRTLLLVGKRPDWQKDNFIWWSINRAATEKLVSTRSMSTSSAGVYNVFWDGVDDAGQPVAPGDYVLHVETSRERGQHTYRSLRLDFGKAVRFVESLPPTEEGGGLRVSFDHY